MEVKLRLGDISDSSIMTDYLSYVFGGVVVVGGIIGFAKAGEILAA